MSRVGSRSVTVVGAGIAGAACAGELRAAGITVRLLDRGRAPGGRMASPRSDGRRVDLGAAYVTVSDDGFAAVVADWGARGLVREWTDTLDAYSPAGLERKTGAMRYAATDGLRSLVRDLLREQPVESGAVVSELTTLDGDAVVLAMPDPQAARLTAAPAGLDWVAYDPVIAVALTYPDRSWGMRDAAFVNDDAAVTMIADDGARRGDGAPVLVAHTTSELARERLAEPDLVLQPVLAAVQRTLGVVDGPLGSHTHRWTFAKPAAQHAEPFALESHDGRWLGVCGDSWCPSGAPRVESAWLSGRALGRDLAARLG